MPDVTQLGMLNGHHEDFPGQQTPGRPPPDKPTACERSPSKTHLPRLLQEVEQGQEVVIARSGVPIARLVAWQALARSLAAPGAMPGQFTLADDFDAPMVGLFEVLP